MPQDPRTAAQAGAAPALTFAFGPFGADSLFSNEDMQRLGDSCRIASGAPLQDFSGDAARTVLSKTEILVTGWGCPPIDDAVLSAAPNLKLIAHAAGSVKHLVSSAVFARGVLVSNAADANAVPVAEFTLAAILLANKQVFRFQRDYLRERAPVALHASFDGNAGNWRKRVGIIGASRIGRRVIELLKPHDIDVVLHDPMINPVEAWGMGVELASLEVLMETCDTVSVHAPLLPSTHNMIDAAMLARMGDGATLINTARGGLIDHAALEAELVSGRLWAILDVTEPETLPDDSPLYRLDNVLLTPHIAGAIGNERLRLGRLIADEIGRYLNREPLRHSVNAESLKHQA